MNHYCFNRITKITPPLKRATLKSENWIENSCKCPCLPFTEQSPPALVNGLAHLIVPLPSSSVNWTPQSNGNGWKRVKTAAVHLNVCARCVLCACSNGWVVRLESWMSKYRHSADTQRWYAIASLRPPIAHQPPGTIDFLPFPIATTIIINRSALLAWPIRLCTRYKRNHTQKADRKKWNEIEPEQIVEEIFAAIVLCPTNELERNTINMTEWRL